jgi:tripartite-type tricarboxylate transporter receptor subunit TctC
MKKVLLVTLVSFGMVACGAGLVFGQPFPQRPIHIFAAEAGGAGDVLSRIVAQELAEKLGQRVLVENRGGGVVAGEAVSKAKPDGHTLLAYFSSLWLMPLMRSHVPYDPIKDFVPITSLSTSPQVLVVHPKLQVNSVKELIALAKSKPGALNYSSAATGTGAHLAAELFKSMTGTNMTRVAYKGIASAFTALMSGETDVMFSVPTTAMGQVQAGKVKALGVSSLKPSKLAPGVPPIAGTVPGYQVTANLLLFAPTGTPAAIVKKLNQDIVQILKKPEVVEKFFKAGAEVDASTPEEAAAFIQAELASMGKVIKDANIRDE